MSDFFRILRGLEIDELVQIIQGSGPPGFTADTNNAPVGSVYVDNTNGNIYTKITAGAGPLTWNQVTTHPLELYKENPVTPISPSALGTNSVAIGEGATANAIDSLAIGLQSLARIQGGVVQASGRFASSGDAQTGKYLVRTATINATPTELFVDGTAGSIRLTLPDDSTWSFRVLITGHRTDVSDGHAGYEVKGVIFRTTGAGTTALQGVISKTILAESNVPWDINITADSVNGSLKITATGQAGKTIRWLAYVETVEVTN